jgi:hypothetical protein
MGEPVKIAKAVSEPVEGERQPPSQGNCVIPQPPLRKLKHPGDD